MGDWQNRRSIRLAKEITVRWRAADRQVEAKATDLNKHGMFIRTKDFGEAPTTLELQFDGGPLRAVVERRSVITGFMNEGVGVEIVEIAEPDLERWLRFLG